VPTNEDGEFELILGNRQLLSVFFIVVILLAVFFTMGYIVGRRLGPGTEVAAVAKPDAKPLVVESPTREPAKTQPKSEPAAAPTETAAQQPAEAPKPETGKAEPPKSAPPEKPSKKTPPSVANGQPAAGETYLQLTATSKSIADTYVDVLRKNKFHAIVAEVPEKPELFRVLIGPVEPGGVNKLKSDLQRAGFPGDQAIRRTF
jgi:cell division septation protein DedD